MSQALTLVCNGTTVRGVTSRVDIVWRRGDTVVKSTNRVTADNTTINNLLVYRDSYTISQLNTSDDGIMYECRLVICASPTVRAVTAVTLDVNGEYFPKMNAFLHKSLYQCVSLVKVFFIVVIIFLLQQKIVDFALNIIKVHNICIRYKRVFRLH